MESETLSTGLITSSCRTTPSFAKAKHTLRFGVRARRDSDQNKNPAGFNGAFTFLGGNEPVLNAGNQIVYDSNGNAVDGAAYLSRSSTSAT